MPLLLAFPGLAALFWAVMLFFKKNRMGAHKIMSLGLLVYVLAYCLFCSLFASWSGMHVCLTFMTLALLVPFLHFRFFKKAVDISSKSRVDDFYLAIVFVLIFTLAIMNHNMGPEMSKAFYHKVVMGENIEVDPQFTAAALWKIMDFMVFKVFNSLLSISGLSVLIWAFVKIVKYDRFIDEYFSGEVEDKKNNMYVFLSAVLCVVPMTLLLAQPFYVLRDSPSLLYVCVPVAGLAVFLVGFYSYRIDLTAEQLRFMIDEDNEKRKLADNVPQKDVKSSGIIFNESLSRLQRAMDEDKVYLDPDLTLIGLSDKLKTNRTYLSKVINLNYDCTFNEYVNNRRIEHALSIIHERSSRGISLKDISAECGYANQASFIRNFTKIMGMTPSEYISKSSEL